MSKQYLTAHVAEEAHSFDIFGLAASASYLITASGDSTVKLWEIGNPKHPLAHEFTGVHRLGAHHVAASSKADIAATAGFGGEIILWDLDQLKERSRITGSDGNWALALSANGDRLASTTSDGKVNIWDTADTSKRLAQYVTKGSFGLCVDISPDGNLVAMGHQNGGIYIFNNTTARIHHSLQGLVKPIRAVKFSPAAKLLAACGDSNLIGLFDVVSGEQVASLAGHNSWIFSLAWSTMGDYLVSGSFDGKVKVWSMESRSCVATQNEASSAVYAVQCLPKGAGVGEGFASAGEDRNINFYRETSGE